MTPAHAQARPVGRALAPRARADEIGDEGAHDLLFLLEQGAARGFGRVRGEHRFDVDARQRGEQFRRTDTGVAQAQQHVVQAVRLRCRARDLVGAPTPDALHALGDVDHLEVRRERAAERIGIRHVEAGQSLGEMVDACAFVAAPDCLRARGLDALVEGLSGLFHQQFPDQAAKPAHVLTQGRVGGFECRLARRCHGRRVRWR